MAAQRRRPRPAPPTDGLGLRDIGLISAFAGRRARCLDAIVPGLPRRRRWSGSRRSGIAPGKRSRPSPCRCSAAARRGRTGGARRRRGASALGPAAAGRQRAGVDRQPRRGRRRGPVRDAPARRARAPGLGGLPTDVQARMESSFGYDLSSVRVHQDGAADEMGARAFARGTDVHFGAGQLDPSSADGQHLMAHELAHVTQQALGRAPRSAQAKLASLLGGHDPLEAEADAMADRAVRGEPAWAGADQGPLRSLPTLSGGAVMPKLKVGGYNYKLAETIAQHVADAGGDREIVALLQRWGRDNKKAGRTFDGWADAIEAARRELDGEGSELDSDDEGGPDGGPPDDGGHGGGPAEWSTLRKVLTAFFIFVLLIGMPMLGVLLHGMNQYEVRPGMQNTAVTMRRELEPVMQMGTQIQQLAASSVTEALRERAEGLPIGEFLDGNPMLELAAPDLRRLRDMGPLLDQIAPQLDALAPMLQQGAAAHPGGRAAHPRHPGEHRLSPHAHHARAAADDVGRPRRRPRQRPGAEPAPPAGSGLLPRRRAPRSIRHDADVRPGAARLRSRPRWSAPRRRRRRLWPHKGITHNCQDTSTPWSPRTRSWGRGRPHPPQRRHAGRHRLPDRLRLVAARQRDRQGGRRGAGRVAPRPPTAAARAPGRWPTNPASRPAPSPVRSTPCSTSRSRCPTAGR
ncbi:MAG: DUF4157 domain-containing protein [Myxococcales bacterium]|nr:DUF4157 domain-containing protein [Myxococcales bacterium]